VGLVVEVPADIQVGILLHLDHILQVLPVVGLVAGLGSTVLQLLAIPQAYKAVIFLQQAGFGIRKELFFSVPV
jgi:hypothetical protein